MSMHVTPSDVLRRAQAVGNYYGFSSLAALAASKKGQGTRAPYPDSINLEKLDPEAREVATVLKSIRDAGLAPSALTPLFVWHSNAAPGRPAPKNIVVQFHALGVEHAIADAVLIRAVRSFMGDLTKAEPHLKLNSMGDKETRSRFARELTGFFRKNGAILPPDCVACSRTDVFEATEKLIACKDGTCEIPSPTDHLSEASRKHFEGVLEYLEATDTPYELVPRILSRGSAWSETCFEVTVDDKLSAWGSRYSELSKPFFKGNFSSVGAVVRITLDDRAEIPAMKEKHNPRFVFVHIGDEAKRESMKIVDTLRHARIPLTQSIGIESLTEQMRFVDLINPPYVLIMGRKEALERSVILRERANHTETFIPLDSLVDRLRAVA
ncbi:MAG: Histidine--tRNA ligase [Parcubacteria group bacterium]|nr:Histidine--tRNA ligase [Parcubacteria group bacterium]